MVDNNQALARFLLQVARAAEELARDLAPRGGGEHDPGVLAKLGSRQAQAYRVLARADRPLRTAEITKLMDYDFSNCWMTLRRLEQIGLVEQIAGLKPQQWRLTAPS